MATRLWPAATKNLARIEFELAPRHARRRWTLRGLALIAAAAAGAAGHQLYLGQQSGGDEQRASALLERQQLERGLEQARLQMRVSTAHGQELERQIDTLNRRLQSMQEEVSFLRRAGGSKRPAAAQ